MARKFELDDFVGVKIDSESKEALKIIGDANERVIAQQARYYIHQGIQRDIFRNLFALMTNNFHRPGGSSLT